MPTTFAGVPLDPSASTGGAAFELTTPAVEGLTLDFDNHWQIELVQGSSALVVRGSSARSRVDILPEALAAATRGLDLLCITEGATHQIAHGTERNVAFWPKSSGGLQMCHGVVERAGMLIRVDGHAYHADGTPHARPALVHQDSMTHFRRSEASGDLGDSFRQSYLALESMLDRIRPQATGESEDVWLSAALAAAHAAVPLPPDLGRSNETPPEAAKRVWYDSERNRHFHAKGSRLSRPLLTERDFEALLKKRHDILTYYVALARRYLNLRRGGGGITDWQAGRLIEMWEENEPNFQFFDDSDPALKSDRKPAYRELSSTAPTDRGAFYARNVDLPSSRRIARWELHGTTGHMWWDDLDGRVLDVDPADRLDVRMLLVWGSADFRHRFTS